MDPRPVAVRLIPSHHARPIPMLPIQNLPTAFPTFTFRGRHDNLPILFIPLHDFPLFDTYLPVGDFTPLPRPAFLGGKGMVVRAGV